MAPRTVAEASDVEFGYLADHGGYRGQTALEECLHRGSGWRAETLLRGYSWVTVCSARAAAALGGAGELAETGMFHQVAELPSGAVWLQATERFDEYEEVAATRVFGVVAPALPGGLPYPGLGQQYRARMA
jgi:hypothetical protein